MVGKAEGVPTKLPEIRLVNVASVKFVEDTLADDKLVEVKLADVRFCDDILAEDISWLEILTVGPTMHWLATI